MSSWKSTLKIISCKLPRLALFASALLLWACGSIPYNHLAVANGNDLHILDVTTGLALQTVGGFQEISDLAYRPDGRRLAIADCFRNEVVELGTGSYSELTAPVSASGCPWDFTYSPDRLSLAAAVPFRADQLGTMFGHLRIAGPNILDRDLMQLPLTALAYRPGGQELAVTGPQEIVILGTGPVYPVVHRLSGIDEGRLAYTIDGSRLIAGHSGGYSVYSAAGNYSASTVGGGAVVDVAVDPTGNWIAIVYQSTISILRAPDLQQVTTWSTSAAFHNASFSHNGVYLAVAETTDNIQLYRTTDWMPQNPIQLMGRIDAVEFRPDTVTRLPVLFVHGHAFGSGKAWFEPGSNLGTTSFAAALSANPQLPIDAFYMELPTHFNTALPNRGLEDDAEDILAMIEGGTDSDGDQHVGILNMPAYRNVDRVAIVAYSQGGISSRYYIKNLMGSRRNGAITVSEFVTLAVPNHGLGLDPLSTCGTLDEQDKIRRQLCGGLRARLISASAPCNNCSQASQPFTTNSGTDATFLNSLNGGDNFADACNGISSNENEAPHSRPRISNGILYINLYAANNADLLVGGHTRTSSSLTNCVGRKLARNLAPNAINREIAVSGGAVHANFPHQWDVICFALRTLVDHTAPTGIQQACQGLTRP